MKINKITNFVIIALVMAAVFQTGKLWLGDMSSHNFFYTISDSLGTSYMRDFGNVKVIEPKNIAVGYGNKKFSVIYSSTETSITEFGDKAIGEVLSKGEYVNTTEIDWKDYLNSKAIIYSYSFPVSASEYIKGFGEVSNEVSLKVKSFENIIIIPGRNSTEGLRAYFINNSEFGEAYCFALENSKNGEKLYSAIERYQQINSDDLIYNSTVQSGFNSIKNNVFVPQWAKETLEYASLNKINPYSENGIVKKELLESNFRGFFTNLSPKWDERDENGVYMFSDDNNVVKYYNNGIFEYYNYDMYESKNEQTLVTAYTACKNFMKKDHSLKTDIFLADVELRSDGLLVFYFDYAVENLPVILSNDIKKKNEINHAIEVIVKSDTVKKYKRYAYDFQINYSKDSMANQDFITAVDNIGEDDFTEIQNVMLGYCVDESNVVKLKWFAETNKETYISDTLIDMSKM